MYATVQEILLFDRNPGRKYPGVKIKRALMQAWLDNLTELIGYSYVVSNGMAQDLVR